MKLEIELDSVYGYKLDDIITEITHRGIHGVTREELAGALLTNIVGLYWDYATKKTFLRENTRLRIYVTA